MAAPTPLRLNAVPKYLQENYGFTVTSRTVRNWAKKGLRNDTLETRMFANPCPTQKHPNLYMTTTEWVDQFLERCRIDVHKIGAQPT